MLISTKPDSKGKEAALYRSRQLTECHWTPVGDITTYTKATGKTKLIAGEELVGMLYSSPESADKFIGENVSFETLLSVVANPDSALYHKDLGGHNNSWPYFGIVCNGLVRYALNIRRRFSTKRWPAVPGMRKVADAGSYTAEEIHLCDVLYAHGRENVSHVALITDVLRDETGVIRQVEVSEAIRPVCKRAQYDLAVFFEKFRLYALWRYDFVDSVPMPDPEQDKLLRQGVPGLPVIAVDYGNKANYHRYEDVVISTFADEESEVEIRCGSEVMETVVMVGRSKIVRKFDRGYYTVTHKNTGKYVEFGVTMPEISHSVENGVITVKADSCDPESKILYMDFREKPKAANGAVHHYDPSCASLSRLEELTEEEKKTGIIVRDIPEDAENFKVYFENKYGIWTHTMIKL